MTDQRFDGVAIPDPGFADDDGSVDPAVAAELARFGEGAGNHAGLLRAVAASRLLVPVVAMLEETEVGADGRRRDKTSSMASVSVQAPDGSRSLLAFTSVDALSAWRPDARPIAASARQVAQAALVEQADALVIDPAGPVPFALTGAELRSLAVAEDPTLPTATVVARSVAAVAAGHPEVSLVTMVVEPTGATRITVVVDGLPAGSADAVGALRAVLADEPLLRARGPRLRLVRLAAGQGAGAPPGDVVYRRA